MSVGKDVDLEAMPSSIFVNDDHDDDDDDPNSQASGRVTSFTDISLTNQLADSRFTGHSTE